jgi:hypothetical protein
MTEAVEPAADASWADASSTSVSGSTICVSSFDWSVVAVIA